MSVAGLRKLMALALAVVQDQARAHRGLWHGVCAVVAGIFSALGVAYLLGGIHVAASSDPYALLLYAPGGMHSWGALMLATGCAVAYGLLAPLYGRPVIRWWLRRALIGTFAFSLFMVSEFVGSGVLTGRWSVAGIVWWFASAILSVLLVKLPPPSTGAATNTD